MMYKYHFNSMSTIVQISINHEMFANDLMPVYKLFSSVEDTCSRFKEDSELSRLNQQIWKEVEVSNQFFIILKDALKFYKETKGVFNPGIMSAIESSGYTKSIEFIKGRELGASSLSALEVSKIQPYQLNEDKQTVVLQTRIDLGGIAKGWVIDRAADVFTKYGYGFINVGGDIRIFGSLPRPLNIGIEDPYDPTKMVSSIQVSDGAVATSTSMKRRWKMNGRSKHHLIDAITGEPSASTIISSTVTAPTALEADVFAKVTLLLGEEDGKSWVSSKKNKAIIINQAKEIWRGGE
ncbi:FAD:protein FMN transferase [Neobacillus ginsengisoli]|uniref:FAD:protein FMN transferase n=1 Tax=Neobacillus ginsengisoli TaxID=904295 RepID=A0ABT9XWS0_9BACI|nr:FAD:protein FMN transferase [Neobacillus ginsengisoli]MDQ0199828.1 thiamine biosynthesis lipoprotein [Neobacillus ginsengisoli]